MGRGIPDRWDAYSAFGGIIRGTRFLPFKVPLKEALCKDLPSDQKFTPRILVDRVKTLQLPQLPEQSSSQVQEQPLQLGLVIDLTNTSRYYDPKEITNRNIKYEKIFTEGHNVPAPSVRRRFKEIVSHFLKENNNNGLLIGVHCTHGVNRTGYLVCRYMIDCMETNPDDAVRSFNEGRGHVIERENYLQHLSTVSSASDLVAEMEASVGIVYPPARLQLPLTHPTAAVAVGAADQHSQSSRRSLRKQHRREKKRLAQQPATELWRQQLSPQQRQHCLDNDHSREECERGDEALHSLGACRWQQTEWRRQQAVHSYGPPPPPPPSQLFFDSDGLAGEPLPYRGRSTTNRRWQANCQAFNAAQRLPTTGGREPYSRPFPGHPAPPSSIRLRSMPPIMRTDGSRGRRHVTG